MPEQKVLKVTISRVDAPQFDGDAFFVTVPGISGEMTLLPHHTALISPLKEGVITIKKEDGTTEVFEIASGTLEISQNHATILV